MADPLKTRAKELKAKIMAEMAAPAGSDSEDYGEFDPEDWGQTDSGETLAPPPGGAPEEVAVSDDLIESGLSGFSSDDLLESGKAEQAEDSWGLTASDEALRAELAADDDEELEPIDPAELSWPDELTPGTASSGAANPLPQKSPAKAAAEAPQAATEALRRELNNKTRDTTLMALAKQGVKNVKVLGMNTVERIVQNAVATTIERSVIVRSEAERKALEQDARKEFFKLLKRHKQVLAEQSQGKQELAQQIAELQAELGQAESALAHEQRASGPNLAPEAIAALEASFKDLLAGFMSDERRQLVQEDDPQALKGLSDLEKKLGAAFDRLLDRVKSQAEELLERRIGKLNAALEETEAALRHLALAKGYDDGVASIYDSIQGLDLGEADYARKKELLSIVFVENLEIQNKEITAEDRQVYDAAIANLKTAPKTEPGLDFSKFSKPVETSTEVAF